MKNFLNYTIIRGRMVFSLKGGFRLKMDTHRDINIIWSTPMENVKRKSENWDEQHDNDMKEWDTNFTGKRKMSFSYRVFVR